MKSEDILKEITYLELISRKNAISFLNGAYLTGIRGKGSEFLEARKYVQGESIRSIDWNISARMGEPFVKIFHEEREREIYIALDISPSMYVGFQEKNKFEFALEISASIAYSAVQSEDKLGFFLFRDSIIEESHAASGRKQFFHFLNRALYYKDLDIKIGKTDIRSVVHSIQKKKGNRFVIFIISDFIDIDIPVDMKYMIKEHDVSLLHIYDIFEYPTEDIPLKLFFENPEDSSQSIFGKPGEFRSFSEQESYLRDLCKKMGFSFNSFPTHLPFDRALAEFFNRKKSGSR